MTGRATTLTLLMISGVANVWFAVQLLGSPAIDGAEPASFVQNHGSALPPAALVDRSGADFGSAANFLLQVEEEVMGDVMRLAGTYWASAAEFDLEYSRAMFEAQSEIRRRLLDVYGNQAAEDPLFRHVFQPLGPKYWFLSSDQQVGIQRLRFERDVRLHYTARARSDALSRQGHLRRWCRDATPADIARILSHNVRHGLIMMDGWNSDGLLALAIPSPGASFVRVVVRAGRERGGRMA
jgi:hypothetical protein